MFDTHRSSSSLTWIRPIPGMDPSQRRMTYGPIRPMESDLRWWERLFRR